jgi:hypothetical protein
MGAKKEQSRPVARNIRMLIESHDEREGIRRSKRELNKMVRQATKAILSQSDD